LEIFGIFGGEDGWEWEVVGVFVAFVSQPEQVEADLIARDQLVVHVALEPFGLHTLVAGIGAVTGDEVVEVGSGEQVLFEG